MTDDRMACAVCARVLDQYSNDGDHVGFVHVLQDHGDHVAVPVPIGEVALRPRCDFCNVDIDGEQWVLPCASFEVAPGHMSDGDFAMCPDCNAAWDRHIQRGMVDRLQQFMPGSETTQGRRFLLRYVWNIQSHALGEPYLAEG